MPRIMIPDANGNYSEQDQEIVFHQKKRINAGDAGAVLFESPYGDPYKLWLQKTGRIPRDPQTDQMRSGILTEPLIAQFYSELKGVQGISQAWAIHDEYPWIQAKSDWWHPERRMLAEFKAPSKDDSKDHEAAKRGVVAKHYYYQCQHLLATFDVDEMEFVSWRSAVDYAVIPVRRDEELWLSVMLPAYVQFWQYLQDDAYPRPQGIERQESEEWAAAARRVLDSKLMKAEAEAWGSQGEATLKRMATAKTTIGAGIRLTWVEVKPRFEIVVTAENAEARDRILKAVSPLEGKAGVKKLTQRSYPPSLWAKITGEKEPE